MLSLCRSDPPFVSPAILIKQGLSSFVCPASALPSPPPPKYCILYLIPEVALLYVPR